MRVFISTGELSGDKNASYLVRKLKVFGWEFYALGGENLKKEGVKVVEDPERISVVGLQEALLKLKEINRIKRRVISEAIEADLIVGVDFPGFNLPLLKILKSLGKKVIYYISPQVWAWGKWRVRDLAIMDGVLCVLPFEEEFLRSYGVRAYFVGHPMANEGFVSEVIEIDGPVFGFLPGSRKDEVRRLLPRMIRISQEIKKILPSSKFLFSLPKGYSLNLPNAFFVHGRGRDVIRSSDVVISSSGTATLESALEGKPTIVLYMVSEITYWVGRLILKVPYISLPNIILRRKIFPEFVQHIDPKEVSRLAVEMLERREEYKNLSESFSNLLKGKYDEVEVFKEILNLP